LQTYIIPYVIPVIIIFGKEDVLAVGAAKNGVLDHVVPFVEVFI
jgi:hypothetical protein